MSKNTQAGKQYNPGIYINRIARIFNKHYKRDAARLERILFKKFSDDQVGHKLKERMKQSLKFEVKPTLASSLNDLPQGNDVRHGGWMDVHGEIRTLDGKKIHSHLLRVYFVQEFNGGMWQPVRMARIRLLHPPTSKHAPKSEMMMYRIAYDVLTPHLNRVDPYERGVGESLLHDLQDEWVPHAIADYDKVGGGAVDQAGHSEVVEMDGKEAVNQ